MDKFFSDVILENQKLCRTVKQKKICTFGMKEKKKNPINFNHKIVPGKKSKQPFD